MTTSKKTLSRLRDYAVVALEWYVEATRDLLNAGSEVAALVRTQDGWQKVKPKILAKWKIYRLSKKQMEEALPRL